ncbi:MAG: formate/nitrite transporter family protein [Methanobrevibacter sp.]|nr:formate/nitrite transporter family protein [Methanobrevibacter sp.]
MSSFKSPVDTAKAIAATAGAKNSAKITNVILLSFLAGAYIAFGGLLAIVATGGMANVVPAGFEKFVFGAVFPVGLIIVVLAGSELFTGNVMFMTLGVLDGKASLGGLTKNWVISWIFNFVGALFVAYVLAYMGGITFTGAEVGTKAYNATLPFMTKAQGVATGKVVGMTWTTAIIRGIGCNWLVCLAVWLANASDDIIGKIFGIWFPIMAFVCIGFEHSVANMFFIPLGLFCGAKISWYYIITANLIPVTIGNIIGGALFVACIYWYTYLKD